MLTLLRVLHCAALSSVMHLIFNIAGVEMKHDVCHEQRIHQEVQNKHPIHL